MASTIYQYAAKVIQGKIVIGDQFDPISPGYYYSSINVHNPWRHKVKYAVKLAISGPHGEEGRISLFHTYSLGPDGATEFDHGNFANLAATMPQFLEAYFVIQCEEELDVVGVYTGSELPDNDLKKIRLEALHMERIPARLLPRCKDLKIDISTGVEDWQIVDPLPAGSTLQTGPAPIALPVHASWATPPNNKVKWVGSAGNSSTGIGDYIFELTFCLCWTFSNPLLNFLLWADNKADVSLNGLQIATTPADAFHANDQTTVSTMAGFIVGTNTLRIVVHNSSGPCAMMVSGGLSAGSADCTT